MGRLCVKCSFIVSAFDRPRHLACLLRSLRLQTEQSFEVIVTDNARDVVIAAENAAQVYELNDDRFQYERSALPDCYASANYGARLAKGDYLCFPSDDNYYVPRFLEEMLAPALDLVYCDCIYDGYGVHYAPMEVAPVAGHIDKGGFLVRHEKFPQFPPGPPGHGADGQLVEQLVREGVSHVKVPGYLWVHN
jgi:glycosyltransferase involved in cell wall biosynthesis